MVLAAVGAVSLVVPATRTPPAAARPLRYLRGVERWPVKTFSDGDRWQVSTTRLYRTIKQLNAIPRPAVRPPNGRASAEFKTYRVTGTVTYVANEDDGDIHLAIMGADGSSVIAEAPEPACSVNSRDRAQINAARLVAQGIQPSDKVVAVGVAFFDFAHNQIGHAKNYIELHPLLSLRRI
jgi:hypothetical protein